MTPNDLPTRPAHIVGSGTTRRGPSFAAAKAFVLCFGKHKGRTLDEVAETDEGLRYLDWLVGEARETDVRGHLEVYLGDPAIKRELDGLR